MKEAMAAFGIILYMLAFAVTAASLEARGKSVLIAGIGGVIWPVIIVLHTMELPRSDCVPTKQGHVEG